MHIVKVETCQLERVRLEFGEMIQSICANGLTAGDRAIGELCCWIEVLLGSDTLSRIIYGARRLGQAESVD